MMEPIVDKIIHASVWNPSNTFFRGMKNEKSRCRKIACHNSDKCSAYQEGKCVLCNDFNTYCPYGRQITETGYTQLAASCYKWEQDRREWYREQLDKLKPIKHIVQIGEFYYLPQQLYCNFSNNKVDYIESEHFIKDFSVDTIVKLLQRKPRTLFDNYVIEDYTDKSVPSIVADLKRYYPSIYQEVLKVYPSIEEIYQSVSYIGKKAELYTLSRGMVKVDYKCEMLWDGSQLLLTSIPNCKLKFTETKLTPDKDTIVEIIDNDTVNEDTVFID